MFLLCELQKKVPTLLSDNDHLKYVNFRKTYFYMLEIIIW
jgi:hypothetical protein